MKIYYTKIKNMQYLKVVTYILLIYTGINLGLFLIFIFICRQSLIDIFKRCNKLDFLFVILILISQLFIHRYIILPQHFTYVDEFWYMNVAKDILIDKNIYNYPKSIGWPFLITLSFLFFKIDNYTALYLCSFLGSLIFINIFLLTFIIFKDKILSYMTAILTVFLPPKFFWSSTVETHIPSLFFITVSMLFSFIYYEKKKISLLWLSLLGWAYCVQIRPESFLYFILFGIGVFIFCRDKIKLNIYFWTPWIISINLSFPALIRGIKYLFAFSRFKYLSNSYSNVSFKNLVVNTSNWFPRLWDGSLHPLLFSMFIIVGFFYLWVKRRRLFYFFTIWFLFLYIVYFSMWLQVYGEGPSLISRTRLFLFFYPIFNIVGGYGISGKYLNVKKNYFSILSIILLITVIASFFPYYRKYPINTPSKVLETKVVSCMKEYIPLDCIIIANFPSVIRCVNFYTVIDSEEFVKNKNLQREIFLSCNCVLFFKDISCFSYRKKFFSTINKLKEDFFFIPFCDFCYKDAKITFYKLSPK